MNINSLGGITQQPPVQSGEGSLTVASAAQVITMTAKMAALQPVYPLSCDFFNIYLFWYEDERLSVPSRLPLPGENVARGEVKNCC